MIYEANIKVKDGKIDSKVSCEMEFMGMKVKVKDYEFSGDMNKILNEASNLLTKTDEDAGVELINNLLTMVGVKKDTMEKFKDAILLKAGQKR